MNRKVAAGILFAVLLTPGCARHRYEAEWKSYHEDRCRGAAAVELAKYQSFDLTDLEDQELLSDICTVAVARLSERYQDTPPDEIPQSIIEEALNEATRDTI